MPSATGRRSSGPAPESHASKAVWLPLYWKSLRAIPYRSAPTEASHAPRNEGPRTSNSLPNHAAKWATSLAETDPMLKILKPPYLNAIRVRRHFLTDSRTPGRVFAWHAAYASNIPGHFTMSWRGGTGARASSWMTTTGASCLLYTELGAIFWQFADHEGCRVRRLLGSNPPELR